MKKKYQKSGFTLIELLVVIVIVGILSGMGIAGYNSYRDKANNAKEEAECAQIKKCDLLKSTCEKGGQSKEECASLCNVDALMCNGFMGNGDRVYPSPDNWTSANCFGWNGSGTIGQYNVSCGGTDVVIPKHIEGVLVTSIGWSFQNKGLTSVMIPDSVETIAAQAFYVNNLTSVVMPKNLVSIGAYAFASNDIERVFLPKSVVDIAYATFNGNGKDRDTWNLSNFVPGTDQVWEAVGKHWIKQEIN